MDRFDLEQQIMKCWNIVEDITLLHEGVLEKELTVDDISNYLLGLETIYNQKFEKLFDMYTNLIKKGDIK